MSMVPHYHGGRRGGVFDPFSMDIWDPVKDFNHHTRAKDTSSFANTYIDWKETLEAHIFKADLSRIKKDKVKVEVEDDKGASDKRLPEHVRMDEIKASMEHGFLGNTEA
ncbi:hypothetical protein RJ639_018136 [Escallonia herrerae]|uniref:Uncharacterized protein n=1 Tax=Escallonia herrerae TaxID=1293975 RepID=A0AA88VAC8_9ASTE|nr:hypothetical protein RJ639_018136 [Escallonia herrerae]